MEEQKVKIIEPPKKPLNQIFQNMECDLILQEMLKNRSNKEPFEFKPVVRERSDKTYTITATDVNLMNEVFKNGSSSCNDCWGKGYYINHLPKIKHPNPDNFMTFKPEFDAPEDLTGEQKKIWVEMQKKKYDEDPCWKVLQVCHCAAKKTLKDPFVYANAPHTLFFRLDYTVEDKKEEK